MTDSATLDPRSAASEPVVSPALSDAQLRALAGLDAGQTSLSFFTFVPDGSPAALPAELLDSDGTVAVQWRKIASLIAHADRIGSVRYVGPLGVVQAASAGRSGSNGTVLIRSMAAGTEISAPPMITDVMLVLREALGGAHSGPAEFRVELSPAEAIVFVAVIDALRHRSLRILAGDAQWTGPVVEQDAAFTATSGGSPTTDLAAMLRGRLGDVPLALSDFGVALRDLARRGLVDLVDNHVRLGDSVPDLVGAVLVPSGRLQLRAAATAPNDTDLVVELDGVTGAGPGGLLWSVGGETVTLETATGAVLLELIRRFLTAPVLVLAGAVADDGATGIPDDQVCAACAARVPADHRFCRRCGARLNEG